MAMSDFLAVMSNGTVVQYGTQKDIYFHPRNVYVATFVGKPRMSLLEGELESREGLMTLVGDDLNLPLGALADLRLAKETDGRVLVGIRAEHVQVHTDTTGSRGAVSAEVRLLEPIGSDTFVELGIGTHSLVARTPPDLDLAIGQMVSIAVTPAMVHIFDAASGERISE